ncbi:MAG: hypothetical protein QOH63_1945 [Acidobacteriota bacterium]|jgi:site-specific DNA-cytosine methylase|nr:hypothetical protein [Acidobacteriota bacterium]
MKTFASLFTGGDLAGTGAQMAGLEPIWGVEIGAEIAAVAEMNGLENVIVKSVCDVDYSRLQSPYWLHASPVCVNASVAKSDAREEFTDIETAKATARAITALQSPVFSLENVWKYREFESFRIICAALESQGYNFRFWHLNSADYGVPQTRKRLILVASRIRKVEKPQATHRQHGDMFLPAWNGWYAAIEDLIHTLPESKFAEWQLKRLPESITNAEGIYDSQNVQKAQLRRPRSEPAFTVTSITRPAHMPRAFIAHPNADNDRFVVRGEAEPVFTIKVNGNGIPRAFILSDQTNSEGAKVTQREDKSPCFTVDTRDARKVRAFIVDGKPANYEGELAVMDGDSPVVTTTASQTRHPFRAWLSQGRVVSMTPRALARFQSIPDSYALPIKNSLACRVIGNAVCPLLMQRIVEANL